MLLLPFFPLLFPSFPSSPTPCLPTAPSTFHTSFRLFLRLHTFSSDHPDRLPGPPPICSRPSLPPQQVRRPIFRSVHLASSSSGHSNPGLNKESDLGPRSSHFPSPGLRSSPTVPTFPSRLSFLLSPAVRPQRCPGVARRLSSCHATQIPRRGSKTCPGRCSYQKYSPAAQAAATPCRLPSR